MFMLLILTLFDGLSSVFGRGISGEALLVYNFVPINWLWSGFIYPRIRTFVEKRFHGLFSKKKRSKSGGVPSFPRREHVLAENSLPSGQPTALIHKRLLCYLKSSDIFCPRKLFWAKIPLPKNLNFSRKIARFLVSKIRPATGVTHELSSALIRSHQPSSALVGSHRLS